MKPSLSIGVPFEPVERERVALYLKPPLANLTGFSWERDKPSDIAKVVQAKQHCFLASY